MALIKKFVKSLTKIFKSKRRKPVKRKKSSSRSAVKIQRKAKRRAKKTRTSIKKRKTVKKRVKTKKRVLKVKRKKPVRMSKKKKLKPKKKIKRTAKKAKKKTAKKKVKLDFKLSSVLVGEITHYFSKIQVVVIKMTKGSLKVGDSINIKGRHSDFVQKVSSLQIESVDVQVAKKRQLVGLKVSKKAKEGDKVFKLT